MRRPELGGTILASGQPERSEHGQPEQLALEGEAILASLGVPP